MLLFNDKLNRVKYQSHVERKLRSQVGVSQSYSKQRGVAVFFPPTLIKCCCSIGQSAYSLWSPDQAGAKVQCTQRAAVAYFTPGSSREKAEEATFTPFTSCWRPIRGQEGGSFFFSFSPLQERFAQNLHSTHSCCRLR